MSRSLILMRHAKQTSLAVRDHDRPLTPQGRDAAHRVGARLSAIGAAPTHALSSTALRCRETFEALSTGLGQTIPVDFDPALYNASAEQLSNALAGVDDAIESLILLAHNPGISMLAIELGTANESALDTLRAGFTPATIARFEIDADWSEVSPRSARLVAFEPPPDH